MKLLPCKKCGSKPELVKYDPLFDGIRNAYSNLPEIYYYKCKMCEVLAKRSVEEERIKKWNEQQK